jgi:hypothetical protein
MDELSTSLIDEIKIVLESARLNVARQVNNELLGAYWSIGRIIVEHEQGSQYRAEYGARTLRELSKTLTIEFGKGFSVSNIQFMRRFYLTYQTQQTVSVKSCVALRALEVGM